MKNIDISIAGLGNVGSALINIIEKNSKLVKHKLNLDINILGISGKNKNKKRDFLVSKYKWIDEPINLLSIANKKPEILIELMGYEKGISYDLVKSALLKKIHVVTGNKAMLSNYGNELFKIAEENNVLLLFEAAVAGGIPIIKTIKNNIFLNKIIKISGILNGTTNYILTTMEMENKNFEDVLNDAKLNVNEISYINAHGTSTPAGDQVEITAVDKLFSNSDKNVPMSSTKSQIGHLLGAAGAVEAIYSICSLNENLMPFNKNLDNPCDHKKIDLIKNNPRELQIKYVLSDYFGFGGTNVSLIFSKYNL